MNLIWVLMLVSVAFTSIPFFPLGDVSPLAAPFAVILAFLIVSNRSKRPVQLSGRTEVSFLLLFFAYSLITGLVLLMYYLGNSAFKDLTPSTAFLRALVSLLLGITYYLVARNALNNPQRFLRSQRYLMLSVWISILFAFLQFLASNGLSLLQPIVEFVTSVTVRTHGDWQTRYHGFALEPSWFAPQIVLFILPYVLANLLGRKTRVKSAQENLLFLCMLVIAISAIMMSGSRKGLLMAALVILTGLVVAYGVKNIFKLSSYIFLSAAFAAILFGFLANPHVKSTIGRVASEVTSNPGDIGQLAVVAAIGSRYAASQAASRAFVDRPLIGVGLGQSIFNFSRYVDPSLTHLPEVSSWLDPNAPGKPNPKNLYIRLLAEVGISGTLLFLVFLLGHFRYCSSLSATHRVFAYCTIVAVIMDFAGRDTFGLPETWLALALIAGSHRYERLKVAERQSLSYYYQFKSGRKSASDDPIVKSSRL